MDDFERRRELRRQKREEMRQEVERVTYQRNDDDEEEAARERRRRARLERQRLQKDDVGDGNVTEVNSQNSITVEETKSTSITNSDITLDDEAALSDRLAKREERRQKRMKEALERQKEFDPTITDESLSLIKINRNGDNEVEENDTSINDDVSVTRRTKYEVEESETVTISHDKNDEKEEPQLEVEEEKTDEKEHVEETHLEENQVKEEKRGFKEEVKTSWERKKTFSETKVQNGEGLHEVTPKLKQLEKFGGAKASASTNEADAVSKVEAGKKLEDLRRRRGETESGEFDKLKQKQQEAAVELDELKKKREERRKLMEEEEKRKKQEEADRKAREEEEKKRLKEEIEKRRAEAAEKRQNLSDEGLSEEKKPFKCVTPKGSFLKIEDRAGFLNKSAQKSVKSNQPASVVVSKIDSRLEQYTSAIGSNKGGKPAKPAPSDLPLPSDGVRNIKSKWETGNVFSSPGNALSPNKETAGLKVGVSSRISEWLTKTPDTSKSPAAKPSDLRPVDVSGKRNIWEKQQVEKPGSPSKLQVKTGGKKSDANAGLRFENEP
ncbi:caldesmon isoform X1 [Pelobates cultripes]|uniref:Caldesmon isoform X1 n=1 Tax=Pelobates cultripes TaxID=61616 RepID=A0AAD1RS87_PELCU|nr:caldesmon isoform X1 [Pelobates cultripes]CAH2276161.1 caldesmon isoform X1 [Pelobates cultripes]